MQYALMAVRGSATRLATPLPINSAMRPRLCQQSPGIPLELSQYKCLDARGVHGAYANPHPHKPLVQVTMDTEHKLDE